jgi:hypothetical protein
MSEEFELKRIGATPVKNSGRSRGIEKGDGVLEPFLVDVKEYTNSFSVSRDNWKKLSTDAIHNGRRQPMLVLALIKEGEAPIRLWVVGESMGLEMHEAWKEKYGE